MYDDLSLDYTYDHSFNLDEDYASYTYDDLDEDDDRARDTQDFQELAYQHYAWRYSERLADSKIRLHQVPLWREVEPETSYRRELLTFGRGKSKGVFFCIILYSTRCGAPRQRLVCHFVNWHIVSWLIIKLRGRGVEGLKSVLPQTCSYYNWNPAGCMHTCATYFTGT